MDYAKPTFRSFGPQWHDEHTPPQPEYPAFNGKLRKIVITGLPDDDFHLDPLYVRLLASMLHPSGQVGIGQGRKGTAYYFDPKFEYERFIYKSAKGPALTWVKAGNVQKWIHDNGALRFPAALGHWVYKWVKLEVNSKHPFFRGWA